MTKINKPVKIEIDVHKQLSRQKIELGCKTLSDTIKKLLDNNQNEQAEA